MDKPSHDRRRIARNTLLLYARMLLVMLIALYTSRVVFGALGVVDFGLYNVVAGLVTLLVCVTGPMAGTASRYITVALGRGDAEELRRVFAATRAVQLALAAFVLLAAETAGLWMVTHRLVIPPERMGAAMWVYQLSVATFCLSLLTVPYNALIIARERMEAFAYISLFETGAKLGIALCLTFSPWDKLVVYALLYALLQAGVRLLYAGYCRRRFAESRAALRWDGSLLREMAAYSAWCSLGYLALVACTQGANVLLNLFFGPAVNAARAVAVQVQTAVEQLCTNFQTALNPQITKAQASGDYTYLHQLVVYGSKYSYFIMLLVALPLCANAPYVLHLWLGDVPAHTVAFVRLALLVSLAESLKTPVLTAVHATGRIRRVQAAEGATLLTALPLSYCALRWWGAPPETVFVAYLAVELVTQCVRVSLILPRIALPLPRYLRGVAAPLAAVTAACAFLGLSVPGGDTFGSFVLSSAALVAAALAAIAVLGMGRGERAAVAGKLRAALRRAPGR